jgi:hypothetical protein
MKTAIPRVTSPALPHPSPRLPVDEPPHDPVDALVLDLLDWLAVHPRPYAEVMEVWRTSCPRLPVWEEANVRGFVEHRHVEAQGAEVALSAAGAAHRRSRSKHHA